MKALSIRQPWAWAIVHGPKRIENRTWGTSFRGPFLIHAGRSWTKADRLAATALSRFYGLQVPLPPALGGIVGRAELVRVISDGEAGSDDPWFEGPYGFVLANVEPLPFRPLAGKLGWFDVDE